MKPRARRQALLFVAAVFTLGALLPAWFGPRSRAGDGEVAAPAAAPAAPPADPGLGLGSDLS